MPYVQSGLVGDFIPKPRCYNLKSPGVARKAQLLVTVGRGGVRLVGIFKAKLRKVIKGMDYPFIQEKMYFII